MRLGELLGTIRTCYACISITGLCNKYKHGVDSLMEESWYKKARNRVVREISIIETDRFELIIRI